MLVLSRKVGQKIVIDDRVTLIITRISGTRVSVGILAPPGVKIRRDELEPLSEPAQATSPAVPQISSEPQASLPPVSPSGLLDGAMRSMS